MNNDFKSRSAATLTTGSLASCTWPQAPASNITLGSRSHGRRGQASDHSKRHADPRTPSCDGPSPCTEPRMPAIAHLQRLGTMGVPLLAATQALVAWVTCRQANSSGAGAPRSKTERRHSTHGEQRVAHRRPVRFVASDRTDRPWTTLSDFLRVQKAASALKPPREPVASERHDLDPSMHLLDADSIHDLVEQASACVRK